MRRGFSRLSLVPYLLMFMFTGCQFPTQPDTSVSNGIIPRIMEK